ncbi:MAG: DUF4199 domain-containing protein [Flavobacterium haoranii]
MKKESIKNLILTYGFILGLVSIGISVIKYLLGDYLERSTFESILGFIILIVFIYIPINIYKKSNEGYLSLSESFKIGLGVGLISALISILYIYIFANFIEPEFVNNILEIEIEKMKSSSTPAENIKQAYNMMKNYMLPMMFGGIIFVNLFFGFIFSLIIGFILKKDKTVFQN